MIAAAIWLALGLFLSQLPNFFRTRIGTMVTPIVSAMTKSPRLTITPPQAMVGGSGKIELCAAEAILKDHPIRFRFRGSKVPLRLLIILLFLSSSLISADAEPRHGIAMHGEPALPPGLYTFALCQSARPQGRRSQNCNHWKFRQHQSFHRHGATGVWRSNLHLREFYLAEMPMRRFLCTDCSPNPSTSAQISPP